jgi:hypothetical protein
MAPRMRLVYAAAHAACLLGVACTCASSDPGLGYFEDELRSTAKAVPLGSTLDLRVAKAVGSKGYDRVRVSVVSQGAAAMGIDLSSIDPQAYNSTFKYRWEGAFDLGTAQTRCGAANVYNTTHGLGNGYDADCMLACTHDPGCGHYTWFDATKMCELSGPDCAFLLDPLATATYVTRGNNVLASAVVTMRAGKNHLDIGGQNITVNLPAQGSGTRGIVISDPCFSGNR